MKTQNWRGKATGPVSHREQVFKSQHSQPGSRALSFIPGPHFSPKSVTCKVIVVFSAESLSFSFQTGWTFLVKLTSNFAMTSKQSSLAPRLYKEGNPPLVSELMGSDSFSQQLCLRLSLPERACPASMQGSWEYWGSNTPRGSPDSQGWGRSKSLLSLHTTVLLSPCPHLYLLGWLSK